jgi:ribonuclease R
MILANVAAAETLEAKRRPLIYRVHEEPADDKLDALREQMETVGLTFPKGEVVQTRHFNRLLESGRDGEFAELVNLSVLRAQTQAYYSPQNFGHFGLNLRRYAHFTSPIRRYADLIVHRALIAAHGWGDDGLTPEDEATLAETAEHISPPSAAPWRPSATPPTAISPCSSPSARAPSSRAASRAWRGSGCS